MLFVGIDLGTAATKLLLMNEQGKVLRIVTKAYPLYLPEPGWSEQDPEVWWSAVLIGMPELLRDVDASDVRGICCVGQMHGLVILDSDDQVIMPAILWNDSRAQFQADYLNNEIGREWLSAHTGNVAYAGFTAPKLLWLREEEPERFARIAKVMLPKDYLTYRLTGRHVSDCSDASGTLLFDVRARTWSKTMLNLCGLREHQMPEVFESWECVGTVLPEVAAKLGIPADALVCAGASNNAAAAVGTGTVGQGQCNIRIGSSGTILVCNDSYMVDEHNALHSLCHADGSYHLLGCVLSAYACNRWWLSDVLKAHDPSGEIGRIDISRMGHNSVFFLPYLMGERSPYNDPNARGAFLGMGLTTSRADMTQAVLEGVAFALRSCLDVARSEEIKVSDATISGTQVFPLWKQMLADVLGIPLYTTEVGEVTAYGAAMLSAVCCGCWPDVRSCCRDLVHTPGKTTPDRWRASLYQERYDTWRALYPALRLSFKRMR